MKKRYRNLVGLAKAAAVLLIFCYFSTPLFVPAKIGLYQESLSFDAQGNLRMTTRDKKAGGSVRYRTLGWVVRRTKEPGADGESVRLKLEADGLPRQDPNDSDYVFTDFKCPWDLIFAKIGAVSADWQTDLYQNGGMVYLDAVMTVVENGKALGAMDISGVLYGEVYTTAAGIMNARDWADPQALLTHYNKEVEFPAIPELFVPPVGQEHDEKIRFQYGQKECERENEVFIQAMEREKPQFDVTKGIPTGEQAFVRGNMQKYYYEGVLKHYYGVVPVPVEIDVTYTYPVRTENGIVTQSFTNSFTYPVGRAYSYYRIEQLSLFTLKDVFVENQALSDSPMEFTNLYGPRVTLEQNRDSYVEIPVCHAAVFGGDLSAGGGLTPAKLLAVAEQAAEDVWVRNDTFIIDGEIILDGSFVKQETQGVRKQEGERLCAFCSEEVTIPDTRQNGTYETCAMSIYWDYLEKRRKERQISRVNKIVVHTPVVCKGGITDDTTHNQQVYPTSRFSLILGRDFSVGISVFGSHKKQPGYGMRDYGKYVKTRQVRFPFEVYDKKTWIAAGSWIDLTGEQKHFYLPVGVHEGDYRVYFRTIAKNADARESGTDCCEYLANLSMENYGAYDALSVTVSGRMYDFSVTDIVDYPRWKSVFYEASGKKKHFTYWIGEKNLEGQALFSRAAAGRLPILAGDHPYNPNAGAVGLGYRVKLQLKTIGDMRGETDCIVLLPAYFYVSRDGKEKREVRLYRKDDLTEVKKILVLGAKNRSFLPVESRNVTDAALRRQSVQVWDGEYQLSPDLYLVDADVDLDAYIRLHGGRIRQKDSVFLRDGYLLVQFEIRSCPGGKIHLSYANQKNSSRGYCNMWRLQGFMYERRDRGGSSFVFADGDCLLFDTRYSLHSDYESWGTH